MATKVQVDPDLMEVRFVPIKDGDSLIIPRIPGTGWDKNKRFETSVNQIVGFKPGPARTRGGHLVVLTRKDSRKGLRLRRARP